MGLRESLALWKVALDRADCLCKQMLKLGLSSCCTTKASQRSPVKGKTQACSTECCSSAPLESTENLAVEDLTGNQRPCFGSKPRSRACNSSLTPAMIHISSISHPRACCSSSPSGKSIQTDITPAPDMKACCSSSLRVESAQCDNSASNPEIHCNSAPSTKIVRFQAAQRRGSHEEIQSLSDQQSLLTATTHLEEGLAAEHIVTLISGMTCARC